MVLAAAATMAREYDISTDEAIGRASEQEQMFLLTERLALRLGDRWAGARIDQENGGVLIVATTDRQSALDAIEEVVSSESSFRVANLQERVQVVEVEHSAAEILDVSEQIVDMLGGPSDPFQVVPQLEANEIIITIFDGAPGADQVTQEVSTLLAEQKIPAGFTITIEHEAGEMVDFILSFEAE